MRKATLALLVVAACGGTPPVIQGSPYPLGGDPIQGFYCNALSQCWLSEAECPRCSRIDTAWCAVYSTTEDSYPERLMCGVGKDDCWNLMDAYRGPAAHDHGECIRRTAVR